METTCGDHNPYLKSYNATLYGEFVKDGIRNSGITGITRITTNGHLYGLCNSDCTVTAVNYTASSLIDVLSK